MFNRSITKSALMLAAAPAFVLAQATDAWAGCNCQNGGHHSSGHHGSPYVTAAPSMPMMQMHAPMVAPSHSFHAPSYNPIGTVVAPPGTLGQTYRRVSRLIPDEKHPRIGMLEVRGVPADAEVAVKNMKGFRDKTGVWVLESEEPLVPGVPHIYAVKIVRPSLNGDMNSDSRVIRLIPGRIVGLEL